MATTEEVLADALNKVRAAQDAIKQAAEVIGRGDGGRYVSLAATNTETAELWLLRASQRAAR